jgi:phosphoglycolate phosphatase
VLKHVIWDWNGTLLDDVDLCVMLLNELIDERGLERVTREFYREHFGFPVRAFYEKVGFDFKRDDFTRLSHAFNLRYREEIERAGLQPDALAALQSLQRTGISQSMVSATEENMLVKMLDHFRIRRYFCRVKGLGDSHATSKVLLGVTLREELGLKNEHTLLIGDTLHDLETARAIGCRCLLFCGGHQNPARFADTGVTLLRGLKELMPTMTRTADDSTAAQAE